MSCSYYCFFLLYSIVIKNYFIKNNINSEIIDLYNNKSNQILNMDINTLKLGIWPIIKNINNTNVDFKLKGYM